MSIPQGLTGSQLSDCPSELAISSEEQPYSAPLGCKVLLDDIIIDNIFTELDVEDIVRLRQVSTQFHGCSNEQVVWHRIIDRAEHLLPPVPPTQRFAFPNLTSIEAERLLTRAVSLTKQWDKPEPDPRRRWDIQAYREVLEMTLLPGGQYLVASVTDRSRTRYSVEIFTSDFKYSLGLPLARLETPTKAFDLRAKYMTIHGTQGIAIAYVSRHYRRERYAQHFDINSLSTDWEDPSNASRMVRYECTAVHIPLDALELLGTETRPNNPHEIRTLALSQRRPFQVLTEITSRSRISNPVIDEDVLGGPFIAVLKHPDRIVHKNLAGGSASTISCSPHPDYQNLPQSIMAFSVLPRQKQLLVVRRAGVDVNPETRDPTTDQGPYYFPELYDIVDTPGQSFTRTAVSRGLTHDSNGDYWHKVWISDHGPGSALSSDVSVRAHLHRRKPVAPNPVIIFVRSELTYGITYDVFFPSSEGDYELSEDVSFMDHDTSPSSGSMKRLHELYEHDVLPGSTRPIVCSVFREKREAHNFDIAAIGGIWDARLLGRTSDIVPVADAPQEAAEEDDGDATAVHDNAEATEAEGNVAASAEDSADETEENGDENAHDDTISLKFKQEDLRGVSAIAWDETIGRLCIAYAQNTRITVFDFAGSPQRMPG